MASSTIMWLDEASKTASSSLSGRIRATGAWGSALRCSCTWLREAAPAITARLGQPG
jgi:hypothetical protein